MRKLEWPEARLAEVVRSYEAGNSFQAIATEQGVGLGTIGRLFQQHGFAVRDTSERHRTRTCDHDFFDVIDTEEKAYWLGFLAADGCVGDDGRVRVALSSVDAGHLLKLRGALHSDHPLRSRDKPTPSASLEIRSATMAASLGRLGITPRKSLTLEPPALRSDLMRHFWRGEFDGDGCLSLNTSSGQWVATLVGSRGMVDAFSSYARTVCTSKATVRTTKRVYAVQVGGNRACLALMASLYDGATVYLDRKRDLYLRALGDRIPRKPPHGRPTAHDDRGEPAALG